MLVDHEPKELSEFDPLSLALKLKNIVRIRLKHFSTIRDSGWADEFRKLIQDCGGDGARVFKVLKWYDGHCQQPKPFRVVSATMFRRMFFEQLERKCEENIPRRLMEMSEIGKDAAERLRTLCRWPNGSDRRLDEAVERSIQEYMVFRVKYREIKDGCKDRMLGSFLDWVSPELNRKPADFVVGWLHKANKQIAGWTEWNGNLDRFVFSIASERFDDVGCDLAVQFGDKRLWWKFKELIK